MELSKITLQELSKKLSKEDYELFRRGVIMACMITNATWSNWTKGKYKPETKYQPLIDSVAARLGLTVFNTPVAVEGGQQ